MLDDAGIPFEIETPDVDERALERRFLDGVRAIEELPALLAQAKAVEASRRHPGALCLGADQVLGLDGQIIHKAASMQEVASQLARLSGRSHRLVSAFAIARDGRVAHVDEDRAEVRMRSVTSAQIELYLDAVGDLALTSVGGYQIEGMGIHLMDEIRGDHATILGLPILKLLAWLRREGALTL